MASPIFIALFSSVFLLAPRLALATCYWQNSTLAPDSQYSIAQDDTACFPDQDNSPCCGTGWTCLSDGVCYIEQNGESFYYRGTCTDRTWDSQQCPGWCFAENSNTSIPLEKCASTEDWYCCPGDENCSCDTGKDAIKLGASQPVTITVIGSTSWPGFSSTTSLFTAEPLVSDGTSTSTDSQAAATTSASSTNSVSTTTPGSSSQSATSVATSASSSSAAVSSGSGSGSSNTGLAAGLGAGLGAAAVLVGVLAFFLIRSRRRKNKAKAGGGFGYGGLPNSDSPSQKPLYATEMHTPQSAPSYRDDPYLGAEQQHKPELAGAGEYNRTEMPAQSEGHTVFKKGNRAELAGS
ncbi:hypothetical protein LTS07_001118 [Exophiala sideris]|uniref:Mid2 domain-containing protein n=1 Tax=Exophiala sideris TaxID=1016849 RepID=A0ABR0JSR6_9EURO|nr:hypothetical protein LTS07_001118 [Exophiala sideris]KAK5068996.1 hypothetical protein LTR69_001119 [Exophiala sideris]KAK5186593.1 hypothetical protein LTR44_001650 [Eurotiomycetes sp. CCFEE 6388]